MTKTQTISKAMEALGIPPTMKTDPLLIKELLREMKMEDFQTSFAPLNSFLRAAISQKQSIKPMLACIQKALNNKHPAVVEFANLALEKKWLEPSAHIVRALHIGFLLEGFTTAMCNDHGCFLAVWRHIDKKRKECGMDLHNYIGSFVCGWRVSHSVFETVKALSIDPAMIFFKTGKGLGGRKFSRTALRNMKKQGKINYFEKKLLMPVATGNVDHCDDLIRTNIYEAGITDYLCGYLDNATCAQALCEDMKTKRSQNKILPKKVLPEHSSLRFYKSIFQARSKSLYPVVEFSQEWVSLYITWNAAFLMGNIAVMESVLPILFIPSIIDSRAENFMGARALSLWLCVWHNFFLLKDHGCPTIHVQRKLKKMARAWGAINLRYAQALMKEDRRESPKTLHSNSERFYAHPFWHWMQTASFL